MYRPPLAINIPTPPAGQGWSYTPSQHQPAHIRSLLATFTTDATVGTRTPKLQIVSIENIVVYQVAPPIGIAASLVEGWIVSDMFSTISTVGGIAATTYTIPLPDICIPPGWYLNVPNTGVGALDQWSAITAMVWYGRTLWDEDVAEYDFERLVAPTA